MIRALDEGVCQLVPQTFATKNAENGSGNVWKIIVFPLDMVCWGLRLQTIATVKLFCSSVWVPNCSRSAHGNLINSWTPRVYVVYIYICVNIIQDILEQQLFYHPWGSLFWTSDIWSSTTAEAAASALRFHGSGQLLRCGERGFHGLQSLPGWAWMGMTWKRGLMLDIYIYNMYSYMKLYVYIYDYIYIMCIVIFIYNRAVSM